MPKVGSADGSPAAMHAERQGAADAMGLGGLSRGARTAVVAIVSIVFVAAVVALLIITLK